MPRDAVSRTANVERTVRHKWAMPPMAIVSNRSNYINMRCVSCIYIHILLLCIYLYSYIMQYSCIIYTYIYLEYVYCMYGPPNLSTHFDTCVHINMYRICILRASNFEHNIMVNRHIQHVNQALS